MDDIESNQVLEHEHRLISAEIDALYAQKKKIPEEIEDLKRSYEIKMNLLVSMVQSGSLTMEGIDF